MTGLADVHLALFLSRATPLRRWDEMGILEREAAIYLRLRPHLAGISVVTSGGPEERGYQAYLGDLCILYNRWGLSANAYSLLSPLLHGKALREHTVYKTNQLDGSWAAVIAGRLYRKPVIVRAGYMWSEHFGMHGGRGLKAAVIDRLEAFSLEKADAVALTTGAMKREVIERRGVRPARIQVVPNYVNMETFRPLPEVEPVPGRVCCVGRLHPRKNLGALIEATGRIPGASLVLIGEGEQREELVRLARSVGVNVHFAGTFQHGDLPAEINRAEVFCLSSFFEGHPKALIEAMACGVAVVGTDVEGTRDVIRHEETGLLCPPTVDGMAAALARLLHSASLRDRLGQAAREFVAREYSLERTLVRELALLAEVSR